MHRRDFIITAGSALAAGRWAGCSRRQRLESKMKPLHDQMAARVAQDEFPGAVWLLAQGDDIAVDTVGVTAVGGTLPMRRDTIFRIASMTKAVTAAAVMMLVSLIQGVLVRRAANQPFDAFVRERITGPLGMRDTDFFVPANKLDRYAGCGAFTDPASKAPSRMDKDGAASAYASPPVFPAGTAGLVSTVDDYFAFARMLLNGGGHQGRRILSAKSVLAMTTDHITAAQKAGAKFFPGFFDKSGWGYGMRVSTAPDAITSVPGRYGWDGGFGTSWMNDPNRRLIAIVMTQSSNFLFNGGLDAFWRGAYASTA
jgi:CubicO group peptidase (beta-lactamase class C family)